MEFLLSISIDRPVPVVFSFLRDIDQHPQEKGSKVLVLDKITPGPVGMGTRYREVVQMLPFFRGEIISEVSLFEADKYLELTFNGAGMKGVLLYTFEAHQGGTLLKQHEYLYVLGPLKVMEPLIRWILNRKLTSRLEVIKEYLEGHKDN